MRKLPRLEYLNGLAVDREELYSSQEGAAEDGSVPQQQHPLEGSLEESKARGPGLLSEAEDDGNNSLVEVLEQKHEMFGVRGQSRHHGDNDEEDEITRDSRGRREPNF